MGTIHRALTLGRNKRDKKLLTPTLILPPQGGGNMWS